MGQYDTNGRLRGQYWKPTADDVVDITPSLPSKDITVNNITVNGKIIGDGAEDYWKLGTLAAGSEGTYVVLQDGREPSLTEIGHFEDPITRVTAIIGSFETSDSNQVNTKNVKVFGQGSAAALQVVDNEDQSIFTVDVTAETVRAPKRLRLEGDDTTEKFQVVNGAETTVLSLDTATLPTRSRLTINNTDLKTTDIDVDIDLGSTQELQVRNGATKHISIEQGVTILYQTYVLMSRSNPEQMFVWDIGVDNYFGHTKDIAPPDIGSSSFPFNVGYFNQIETPSFNNVSRFRSDLVTPTIHNPSGVTSGRVIAYDFDLLDIAQAKRPSFPNFQPHQVVTCRVVAVNSVFGYPQNGAAAGGSSVTAYNGVTYYDMKTEPRNNERWPSKGTHALTVWINTQLAPFNRTQAYFAVNELYSIVDTDWTSKIYIEFEVDLSLSLVIDPPPIVINNNSHLLEAVRYLETNTEGYEVDVKSTPPSVGQVLKCNDSTIYQTSATWTDLNIGDIADVTASSAELNVLDIGSQTENHVLTINPGGTTAQWKESQFSLTKTKFQNTLSYTAANGTDWHGLIDITGDLFRPSGYMLSGLPSQNWDWLFGHQYSSPYYTSNIDFSYSTDKNSVTRTSVFRLGATRLVSLKLHFMNEGIDCQDQILGTTMYLTGDAFVNDGVAVSSDEKLKKNIENSDLGLNIIQQLKVKKYDMIDDRKNKEGKKKFGFLAGQVEQTLAAYEFDPVRKMKRKKYSDDGERIEEEVEEVGIDYASFVPIAVKAIQEQQELIINLTQRIEQLENKA